MSPEPIDCKTCRELVHRDRKFDGEKQRQVADHLAGCISCRKQLAPRIDELEREGYELLPR